MRNNQRPASPGRRARRGAGFTMIEIMFAVLIMGILLGLLIGSVRLVTGMSKRTVDTQTVHSIEMGVSQFNSLFGFKMPLVGDMEPGAAAPGYGIYKPVQGSTPARNQISIHSPRDANYLQYMRATGVAVIPKNPLLDNRYSEKSILIYLAGQFSVPVLASQPDVPIDGIAGAGFCKPLPDGSFAIPADLLNPVVGQAATLRKGQTYEPLVALNSNAPKLASEIAPPSTLPQELRGFVADRNGVAIRYYRWEAGPPPPTPPGGAIPLNIPLMVGRVAGDIPGFPIPEGRDIDANTKIRGATFAIVAAGPDGVFGDEPIDDICKKLGVGFPVNATDEVKIRMQAEKDNIVEVGQ